MHLIFCIFLILILIILLLSYFLIRLKFKYKDRIKIDDIYNDLPCVIAIKSVNKNFEYVYANSKFCKLINLSLNEIIGKTDFNLYHKDLAKKYRSLDIEALSDIYNANNFEKAIFEEGEYWNTIRSKFVSSTGEVYITTISFDITNIQQEYLKLEYAKRKIEESDRLKALFLSNINHEVRTQLNTIVGFSELLHETNYIKDKVKYKDIITKNADSLLRIVDNITELTKLESDSVSLEMSWFEINDLLVSLNNRYKFNDSIRFEIIAPYPDMKIFSDKDCLIHIIDNLLNNSYKFTSEGEIKFGFNIKERGICFYVIDSGIGVSGELQDKVFDKFVKIDTESNGLGLGLYICKSLVQAMGGEIGFSPSIEKGAKFWFYVPCEYTLDKSMAIDNTTNINTIDSIDKFVFNKLLFVNFINDINIANYNIDKKISLYSVDSYKEMVQAIFKNNFDAIFINSNINNANFISSVIEIRNINPIIPIIIITEQVSEEERFQAVEVGCSYFINKPLTQENIDQALKYVYKDLK